MAFMKPHYLKTRWIEIDGTQGTRYYMTDWFTKASAVKDYKAYGDGIYEVNIIPGYGARLTAPGYLDATDWVVFDTLGEAKEYIEETFDVDPDTGEELD